MIWLSSIIITIGAILQASAYSVPHLIAGRIISGVGTGLETSTFPMYQAELCEGRMRGCYLLTGNPFSWFDFDMSFASGSIAWRLPITMQIVFAIFVFLLVFGLPEPPRWLYTHDRAEETYLRQFDCP